jgi:NAD(P)-dependent dehydrogenase (short-subunit alcohol dehydrogenase family)
MEGQRVLITGGGSGIGLRLAERFSEAGAQVTLCDADTRFHRRQYGCDR